MTAISWKNGVNGDWSTAADWSGGTVPQSTDTVTIAATGTYTLTITAAEAAANVTLAAAGATLLDSSSRALVRPNLASSGPRTPASTRSVNGGPLKVSRPGSLLHHGANTTSLSASLDISGLTATGTENVPLGGTYARRPGSDIGAAFGPTAAWQNAPTGTDAGRHASDGSLPTGSVVIGSVGTLSIYYIAGSGNNLDFFATDGTSAGTAALGDFAPSLPASGTVLGAYLSNSNFGLNFVVSGVSVQIDSDPDNYSVVVNWDTGLYTTNGTSQGTELLTDLPESDGVDPMGEAGGITLFETVEGQIVIDNPYGVPIIYTPANFTPQLYETDGTPGGTRVVSASWVQNLSGDWGAPANWLAGTVPGSSDDVLIEAGSGTVTVGSAESFGIDSVTLFSGTLLLDGELNASSIGVGHEDFVIAGGTLVVGAGVHALPDLDITGGELDVASAGTLVTSNSATIVSNIVLDAGSTWTNTGVVNVEGNFYVNNSGSGAAIIVNETGAVFDMTSANPYLEPGYYYNSEDIFANAGTLEATSGVTGTIAMTVNNTGLISVARGATLELDVGGTIGGTLSGTGTLELGGSGTFSVLFGTISTAIALTDDATLAIAIGQTLTCAGPASLGLGYALIAGSGTLITTGATTIGSNLSTTTLRIGDDLTWINSGKVTVIDEGDLWIGTSSTDSVSITNAAGASFDFTSDYYGGDLYNGTGTFTNAGTLAKTGGAFTNGDGMPVINSGLIEVSVGTLELGSVTSTGSLSVGSGATLRLDNGGVLNNAISAASGTLLLDGGTLDLTAAQVKSFGNVLVSAARNSSVGTLLLTTSGTFAAPPQITDYGTLGIAAGQTLTCSGPLSFNVEGGYLTGPGTLVTTVTTTINENAEVVLGGGLNWLNSGIVNDAGGVEIYLPGTGSVAITNGAGATFDLTSDNGGVDDYGGSTNLFTNAGTLAKTGGTLTSIVGVAVTNNGLIQVESGTLALNSTVINAGELLATAGGVLNLASATLSNFSGNTLTGGTYEADAGSIIELANNASIAIDSASVMLSGLGSSIEALNTSTRRQATLDSTLGSIAAAGTLALASGRNFTAAANHGTFAISGLLSLGGVNFAATKLSVNSSGSVSGSGTVSGAVANLGDITALGALMLNGALSGGGVLNAAGGAVLDLMQGGTLSGSVSGLGTLQLDGAAATVLAGASVTVAATKIDAGATLSGTGSIAGSVADAGTLAASGGTLLVNGAVSGTGALQAAAGAVLDLAGGGTLSGAIAGAGILQIDGPSALVLQPGASLAVAGVKIDAGATLDLQYGGSLGGTMSGAGTLKLDGSSYALAAGTTLAVGTILLDADVTLAGAGTLSGAVSDAGTLAASGGMLVLGAVTGAGALSAAAGAILDLTAGGALSEQISGAGTLQLDTAAYSLAGGTLAISTVAVDAGATLTGSGTVQGALTDGGSVAASGGTLTLDAITGAGTLSAAAAATLDLTAGGTFTEQIAGAGTLQLNSASYTLGTVLGIGSVLIDAGASLAGPGTLTGALTDNGALLAGDGTLAVEGAISGTGSFVIASGATMDCLGGGTLAGAFSGAGQLLLDDAAFVLQSSADMAAGSVSVDAGASLSGAGTIAGSLADNGSVAATAGTLAFLGSVTGTGSLSAGMGAVLDLKAGGALTELITGPGTLTLQGTSAYTLAGQSDSVGTVAVAAGATLSGFGALTGAVQNNGTVMATGGKLVIGGAVSGPGVLQAATGATLDLAAGGSLTETVSGAGTLEFGGVTTLGTAHLTVATVEIDAGASISATGSLTSIIRNSGTLAVLGGRLIATGAVSGTGALSAGAGSLLLLEGGGTLSGGASGAGTLELFGTKAYTLAGSAAFDTASLVVASNAHVAGTGTIGGALANSGVVTASGGTLVLAGPLSGTGALAAASGAVLDLTAGGTLSQAVSGAGTLELGGAYVLGAKLPTVTAIRIDASASLSGTGSLRSAIDDLGTLAATGGTLALGGILSGSGTLSAAAGALLDLAKGGSFAGAITGGGTADIAGALTLDAGATIAAANMVASANVTLGASASITNTASTDFALDAASGRTVALNGPATASFTNAGSLAAAGAGTADVSVAFINLANVSANSGTMAFLDGVTNTGTIDASAAALSFSKSVGGIGTLQIGATGTLGLLAGADTGQIVDFLAGTGLLNLTAPTSFLGTIDGFSANDEIDLLKTPESSFAFSNGVLTVKDGTKVEATLNFGGTYTQSDFTLVTDGHSGTFIQFV